jgi:hypothetical protein
VLAQGSEEVVEKFVQLVKLRSAHIPVGLFRLRCEVREIGELLIEDANCRSSFVRRKIESRLVRK